MKVVIEVVVDAPEIKAAKIENLPWRKNTNTTIAVTSHNERVENNIITNDGCNPGQVNIPLKRNDIFKTLFKPVSKIKSIEAKIFAMFCTQYPCFKIVWDLINSFRAMVRGKDSNIRELSSFVNGIERDYDAVINAIDLQYSNGLAEGSVNKIKVIKRDVWPVKLVLKHVEEKQWMS